MNGIRIAVLLASLALGGEHLAEAESSPKDAMLRALIRTQAIQIIETADVYQYCPAAAIYLDSPWKGYSLVSTRARPFVRFAQPEVDACLNSIRNKQGQYRDIRDLIKEDLDSRIEHAMGFVESALLKKTPACIDVKDYETWFINRKRLQLCLTLSGDPTLKPIAELIQDPDNQLQTTRLLEGIAALAVQKWAYDESPGDYVLATRVDLRMALSDPRIELARKNVDETVVAANRLDVVETYRRNVEYDKRRAAEAAAKRPPREREFPDGPKH